MLTLNLVPASDYDRENYGVTFESAEIVDVTGPGVHNRNFAHRVYVKDNGARIILSAQVTVIANTPVARPPYAGTVTTGEVIRLVSGTDVREYVVTARPLANPILVPVTE